MHGRAPPEARKLKSWVKRCPKRLQIATGVVVLSEGAYSAKIHLLRNSFSPKTASLPLQEYCFSCTSACCTFSLSGKGCLSLSAIDRTYQNRATLIFRVLATAIIRTPACLLNWQLVIGSSFQCSTAWHVEQFSRKGFLLKDILMWYLLVSKQLCCGSMLLPGPQVYVA